MNDKEVRVADAVVALHGVDIDSLDIASALCGVRDATMLCGTLATKSGWWNRRNANVPMVTARPVRELLASEGYPAGAPMTISEINASVPEKLCLIHSEISEAMEGHRKGLKDDHLPHREMLEVELADAVIRIFDLAYAMGLDIGGAMIEKLAYNQRRADHKPEARAAEGGKTY